MKGDKEWACFPCIQKSVHSKLTEANHMDFLFIFWINKEIHERRWHFTPHSFSFKLVLKILEQGDQKSSNCKYNVIPYHLTLYSVFNIHFAYWHDEYMTRKVSIIKWNKILLFFTFQFSAMVNTHHRNTWVVALLTYDELLHCNYIACIVKCVTLFTFSFALILTW